VNASNSAAQVSTSRKVVWIPRPLRSARTAEVALQQVGELGVGEAELLRPAQEVRIEGGEESGISSSISWISRRWCRNQGSIFVSSKICSTV
jgi:hypothetical protein